MIYKNLTPTQEREIFQRVQLGMPLTSAGTRPSPTIPFISHHAPAEKLQASDSPMATWIALLSRKSLTSEDGLSTRISVDLKRGRDFQSLAQLVYCCYGIPDRRVPSAQKLDEWISQPIEPTHEFKNAMNGVLATFWYLADEARFNKGFVRFKERVAPVEFVFIGTSFMVAG